MIGRRLGDEPGFIGIASSYRTSWAMVRGIDLNLNTLGYHCGVSEAIS